MKFIFDENSERAINTAFISQIFIFQRYNGGHQIKAQVEDSYNSEIILKEFNSGDEDKDFSAAKFYLAKLVASLNGGQ